MAFLSDLFFSDSQPLPFALPTSDLRRGDWMVVAAVCLPDDAALEVRCLQLRLEGGTGSAPGTVRLALLRNYDPALSPWALAEGGAAAALNVETPLGVPYPLDCTRALAARDPAFALTLSGPGIYHLVVGFEPSANDGTVYPDADTTYARLSVMGQGRFFFGSR